MNGLKHADEVVVGGTQEKVEGDYSVQVAVRSIKEYCEFLDVHATVYFLQQYP